MSGRDLVTGAVRAAVNKARYRVPRVCDHAPECTAEHWQMMRAAELECDHEKRPVSVLIGPQYRPPSDMPWVDERMEDLRVRREP